LKYWYYPGLLLLAAHLPLVGGTVTLDFEGFPDGTVLTTQYPGLTFTNTIILTAGTSLNEFEFPPRDGVNLASDNNGAMSISFASPILSFAGYFTYTEPLSIQAFDGASVRVASTASLFSKNFVSSGNPPNEFLTVGFASGISSVTITGDPAGGSFTLDDATINTGTSVPEPGSALLLFSALGAMMMAAALRKWHPWPSKPMKLLLIITIALVLGLGAAWLHATPPPAPSPQTATQRSEQPITPTASDVSLSSTKRSAANTPAETFRTDLASTALPNILPSQLDEAVPSYTIGLATANPPLVYANSPTALTVSIYIADPTVIPASVNLQQITNAGAVIVEALTQASSDPTLYTGPLVLNQPTDTLLEYRVSAAFQGTLTRFFSQTLTLPVTSLDPSGWLTYQSSFGYGFKYPQGWVVATDTDGTVSLSEPGVGAQPTEGTDFTIQYEFNNSNLPMSQYFNGQNDVDLYTGTQSITATTIGSMPAISFSGFDSSEARQVIVVPLPKAFLVITNNAPPQVASVLFGTVHFQ
jgi:hypothetical protein